MENKDIYNKIKNEVLKTYPQNGIDIVIPGKSDYSIQLTTTSNELQSLYQKNNTETPIINFTNCDNLLKQVYNISETDSLIFIKYEKTSGLAKDNNIQYELYDPINFKKLNLSICINNNIKIDVVIPIELDEDLVKIYKSLKKEGYDLFDLKDNFYIDICAPFTADNGADVLLDDRLSYFYSKVVNISTCPKDCEYSTFYIETKSLSCQCKVNENSIDTDNINNNFDLSVYFPALNGFKYTTYKTLKCYKLIFDIKYFKNNIGSIIVIVLIFFYLIFMIYYIMKGISPLEIQISQFLFDEKDINLNKEEIKIVNPALTLGVNQTNKNKNKTKEKTENKVVKTTVKENNSKRTKKGIKTNKDNKDNANPPKGKKARINSADKKKENENLKLVDVIHSKKKKGRNMKKKRGIKNSKNNKGIKDNKKAEIDVESVKSDKVVKRKSIIDYQKEKEIKLSKEKILVESSNNILMKSEMKGNTSEKTTKYNLKKSFNNNKENKGNKLFDNYELNHLDYEDAVILDKRSFCETYWSIIKREELILFTFVSSNDYNLFYIKIARLIFIFLTLMTMNAFLFSDKSFHKLFLKGVKYNFTQQILQILLSVIITHVVEILLCFLSMTDRIIYQIKKIAKTGKENKVIFDCLKKIRIKLIIFFVGTFIVILFYWYFISAFCSVYKNTQKIFLIDTVLSFVFFNIVPLIVYVLVTLVRIISLKCSNKKNLKCLYILSRIFPIF